MFKVLIVDDERIEREGLRAMLQRGLPNLEIEEASNGNQAVEIAATFRPDLVLMDIKMPGMSGIEAVERIAAAHPSIGFIVVSAFDTFDYARQAMKLGVKDYLLKPSKAREIVDTVGRVLRGIEEERRSVESNRQQQAALRKAMPLVETDIVTQLLFDHVHEVHLEELIGLLDIQSASEMFVMNVLLPPIGSEALYRRVKEKVRQVSKAWIGAMYGRQIPIIVFREPGRSFRSQAVSVATDILSIAKGNHDAGWFVGIGGVCSSLSHIRQSYQEALIASKDTSPAAKYRIHEDLAMSSAKASNGSSQVEQLGRLREKRLLDALRLGQWEEVQVNVLEVIDQYEKVSLNLIETQQRILELFWLASRMLSEMGMEAEAPTFSFQAQDFRQLRAETGWILQRMKQVYTEHYNKLEPDIINRIRQYIKQHSHEDISLESIGKQVGLSPFYISKLFKEQMGVNYIDFLTECRIEKAKSLMSDPSKSLKEITYEIGYHDPNYFSKVFKKTCDLSPTEYRKALLQGRNHESAK